MRALVPVSLLAALAIAPAAQPLAAAPADPCRQAAVSKRLGTMVAGLNGGRGDRFVGRRRITQLATISIGAEAEWHLSALRRVGAGRYTINVAVQANDRPWGRGRTALSVDCRTGLVRSWIGPATRHPLPVDDD
jgi:predicted lipid-binding transport protein (Tim44 family)